MLAILGHLITTAGNRLPGDIAFGVPFASVKSGLAAFDSIPAAGSLQLVSRAFTCTYIQSLLLKHLPSSMIRLSSGGVHPGLLNSICESAIIQLSVSLGIHFCFIFIIL